MAWLAVTGAAYELTGREIIIGSGAQAAWRVQNMDLRARHFIIWHADNQWTLRPYSGQDVVALNGRQVPLEAIPLKDGDRIAAGGGVFRFSLGEPRIDELGEVTRPEAHLVDDRSLRAYVLGHSTVIGSDVSNHLHLDESGVADFHAEVRREAGGFALHAMGTQETRVNGRRCVSPCLLTEGDRVEIAGRALRFTSAPLPEGLRLRDAEGQHGATAEPRVSFARPAEERAGAAARRPRSAIRSLAGIGMLLLLLGAAAAFLGR